MKQVIKLFAIAILGMVMGCGGDIEDDFDSGPDFSEIAGDYYGEFSYVTLDGIVSVNGYAKVTVNGENGTFIWQDSSGDNEFLITFVRENDFGSQVFVETTLAGTTSNGDVYWVGNGTSRDGYFTSTDNQFIVLAQAVIDDTVITAVSFTGIKQ
jgi:hypothetical protein